MVFWWFLFCVVFVICVQVNLYVFFWVRNFGIVCSSIYILGFQSCNSDQGTRTQAHKLERRRNRKKARNYFWRDNDREREKEKQHHHHHHHITPHTKIHITNHITDSSLLFPPPLPTFELHTLHTQPTTLCNKPQLHRMGGKKS